MPWPIPTLVKIEYPKPVSWRAWLPTLLIVASSIAGAVLLLWPHGKPTNTPVFLSLFVGAPLVACGLVFGAALDRWESKQVEAEEGEREQDRLVGLWRSWSQRHLRVAAAVAISHVPTARFAVAKGSLPVNKDRAKGLSWKIDNAGIDQMDKEQYGRVLLDLVTDLKPVLEDQRELAVTLFHTDIPKQITGFEHELKSMLEQAAPGTRFSIEREPVTDCASWLARQVDEYDADARLIVAVQMWPDDDAAHAFSEGVAAILLVPEEIGGASRFAGGPPSHNSDWKPGRVLRPMLSAADKLEPDVACMVEMQNVPQPKHYWHTGCDPALSSAIQSAIKADPKHPVVERSFDHVMGLAGPATSWIMLATILEAAPPDSGAHLFAARDASSEQLHLCMIVPAAQKFDSEGTRSES